MLKTVSLDKIKPNPFCPREKSSESMSTEVINSFAAEIKKLGWWGSGLKARKVGDHYEIAFGRRRLAALKKAGHKTIELDVDDLSDDQMKLLTAAENFQRHGLDSDAQVIAWKQVLEVCQGDVGEAMKLTGLSKPTATALNDVLQYQRKQSKNGKSKGYSSNISPRALSEAKRLGSALGSDGADAMIETARRLAARPNIGQDGFGANVIRSIHTKINKVANNNPKLKKDLVAEAIAGRVKSADQVEATVRRVRQKNFDQKLKAAKEKLGPPDLLEVVAGWVRDLPEIIAKIQEVASLKEYADYIVDGDPGLASQFKKLLRELVTEANKLESNIVPRIK